jgi:6-phosphofructokinase
LTDQMCRCVVSIGANIAEGCGRAIDEERKTKNEMPGKLLIGQAGGATTVINASLVGVIGEAQKSRRFDAIWGMRQGAEGMTRGDFVDLGTLSGESLRAIAETPGAALGSSRHKLSDEEAEAVLRMFDARNIRFLIYIGGNDSADTVHRLARMAGERRQDLIAVAVPKTIDNDLPVTDHSPGYGSIARYAATATMDSAKDTESMPAMYPVKFIEVMGRDAGWVAAAATLGKREPEDAPHLVYLPERPVARDQLLEDVARAHREFGRVVAVVTETMRDDRGMPFADPQMSEESDAFGHPLLRGTAEAMVRLVQSELGLRSRFDKPGSLQRMAMSCVSSVDLSEAAEVGRAAVRMALSGMTDQMVTLVRDSDDPYTSHTSTASLSLVANRQQLLPDSFLTSDGRGTTDDFRRYAMPLLGADPFPRYARLTAPRVELGKD